MKPAIVYTGRGGRRRDLSDYRRSRVEWLDEGLEDLVEGVDGGLAVAAKDDLIRVLEVLDGCALAEELRVHRDMEIRAELLAGSVRDNRRECLRGRRWDDCALRDDNVITILLTKSVTERFGGCFDN